MYVVVKRAATTNAGLAHLSYPLAPVRNAGKSCAAGTPSQDRKGVSRGEFQESSHRCSTIAAETTSDAPPATPAKSWSRARKPGKPLASIRISRRRAGVRRQDCDRPCGWCRVWMHRSTRSEVGPTSCFLCYNSNTVHPPSDAAVEAEYYMYVVLLCDPHSKSLFSQHTYAEHGRPLWQGTASG